MQRQTIFTFLVVGSLLFITLGDRVLPKPFAQYSRNTRHGINQMLLGLFPKGKPQRPSQQREEQLEKFQRRADPTPAHD